MGLLGLYVALLPFPVTVVFADGSELSTGPSDIVLVVLLLFAIPILRIPSRAWSHWHTAVALMPLLSGLGAAISGQTLGVAVIAAKIVGLITLFLLYLTIVVSVRTWDEIRWVLRIFVTAVVWMNVVATTAFVLGVDAFGLNPDSSRLSALNPDPNAYGGLILIALVIAIPTMKSDAPVITGRLTRIAVFLLPLSLFLTNSRSTWIATGVAIAVLASAMPKAWFRFALIAAAAIAAITYFLPGELANDQFALAGRGSSSRFELFDYAWEAFWSNPLVGIGLGQFAAQHGYIVHSTMVWWLGEFGIVGLVAITGFLGTFLWWGWRVYRIQTEPNRSLALGLLAGFISMAVFSLGIEALYQRWWWLIMALIAAMRLATDRELQSVRHQHAERDESVR